MINKNDSLLNLAMKVVEESKRPLSIKEIANKVFKIKEETPTEEQIAQFGIDFMLSGDFICCGNRNKENVWDLKSRQPVAILDKDVIEDLHADDEDVQKNTLTNENMYNEDMSEVVNDNQDEDEENNETDDIAEELGFVEDDEENPNGGITEREVIELDEEDDDEDEEDDGDGDLEDIVVGTIKE